MFFAELRSTTHTFDLIELKISHFLNSINGWIAENMLSKSAFARFKGVHAWSVIKNVKKIIITQLLGWLSEICQIHTASQYHPAFRYLPKIQPDTNK